MTRAQIIERLAKSLYANAGYITNWRYMRGTTRDGYLVEAQRAVDAIAAAGITTEELRQALPA